MSCQRFIPAPCRWLIYYISKYPLLSYFELNLFSKRVSTGKHVSKQLFPIRFLAWLCCSPLRFYLLLFFFFLRNMICTLTSPPPSAQELDKASRCPPQPGASSLRARTHRETQVIYRQYSKSISSHSVWSESENRPDGP